MAIREAGMAVSGAVAGSAAGVDFPVADAGAAAPPRLAGR